MGAGGRKEPGNIHGKKMSTYGTWLWRHQSDCRTKPRVHVTFRREPGDEASLQYGGTTGGWARELQDSLVIRNVLNLLMCPKLANVWCIQVNNTNAHFKDKTAKLSLVTSDSNSLALFVSWLRWTTEVKRSPNHKCVQDVEYLNRKDVRAF